MRPAPLPSSSKEPLRHPDELSEHARRALSSQIARPLQMEPGTINAITMDPMLEQQIAQGLRKSQTEILLAIEPGLARHIMDTLSNLIQKMISSGLPPVVICSPQIRLAFRRFYSSTFAELSVLSFNEIPNRVDIKNVGIIPAQAQ